MDQYPSAAHLSSWAGICSGNKQSGGKRLSSKITPGNKWLKMILVQMAHAAARRKGTYLQSLYARIAARRGKKRAVIAVAHSLLVSLYPMLKNGVPYEDLGPGYFDKRNEKRTLEKLTSRIAGLGFEVTLKPITA